MSRVHNHDNFHHTFISRTYNRVAKQQSLNKFQAITINPYNTQDGFSPKLPQGNHLAWINTTKPNVLNYFVLILAKIRRNQSPATAPKT